MIGLPLGFALFNKLPAGLTLRPRTAQVTAEVRDGVVYVRDGNVPQLLMLARVVWFMLIGWWAGGIYSFVAWLLVVILITMPIRLWMYNRIGAVMTLLRY